MIMSSTFRPSKNRCLALALAIVAFAFAPFQGRTQQPAQPSSDTLCVMTYNLRYASPNPPNAWPTRRPLVRQVVQTVSPDVMGTQEGLYANSRTWLRSAGLRHDWLGRDGGSRELRWCFIGRRRNRWPSIISAFTPEIIIQNLAVAGADGDVIKS
jgi:hypothetical protein